MFSKKCRYCTGCINNLLCYSIIWIHTYNDRIGQPDRAASNRKTYVHETKQNLKMRSFLFCFLNEQCCEIFDWRFFSESFFSEPHIISLVPFQFFSNFVVIFRVNHRCGVVWHRCMVHSEYHYERWWTGKSLKEWFSIFCLGTIGYQFTLIDWIFLLNVQFKSDNTVIVDPASNRDQCRFRERSAGVIVTGVKFVAGLIDTVVGPPWIANIFANVRE